MYVLTQGRILPKNPDSGAGKGCRRRLRGGSCAGRGRPPAPPAGRAGKIPRRSEGRKASEKGFMKMAAVLAGAAPPDPQAERGPEGKRPLASRQAGPFSPLLHPNKPAKDPNRSIRRTPRCVQFGNALRTGRDRGRSGSQPLRKADSAPYGRFWALSRRAERRSAHPRAMNCARIDALGRIRP